MKAVRLYAAGDLRVEDIAPPPAPRAGEVRLTVTAAGICGSDLHNFRTGAWISRSPSVAGHEFAGRVTAVGEGVDGLALGDAVVADSRVTCGVCAACRSGRPNVCEKLGFVGEVCDGGFAEEAVLPASLLIKAPDDVDAAALAMAEPLAVALHAVRRLAVPAGSPVLIAGCGPIGGLAALLLSERHDGPLFVADRNADRAGRVAEVTGARIVELTAEAVAGALGGAPLLAALDATGHPGVIGTLVDLVAPGGILALVGIGHGSLAVDPVRLVEREITLAGCHAFTDELPQAVALMPALQHRLLALVDEAIDLDGVPAAYERLLAGRSVGLKTIIQPRPA
ncbi:Alcohol dehydrogenase GroES domain protein [uncultured Pleomorphomonas sp.]|uniref:Alcohol dehydrogenase GroES domain protein n=1 Tax=uncultured Pleomorphomonas sp. TaxID=442121 RepID=A0A212LL84_9HYPH|nr:alcohol dehydrogenase catalytic domain-containing protein [uncultured Pleomorphomonas sp.]SCM78303.1 Alcohol dehydrogenase GroES domain protein [uncultured Pleomorphomonas sp.]